jgi:hypothetical protein
MPDLDILDDNEFLALLEQNLGRRWPREWRVRLWSMAPPVRFAIHPGTCSAVLQQQAIDAVRAYAVRQAVNRLS